MFEVLSTLFKRVPSIVWVAALIVTATFATAQWLRASVLTYRVGELSAAVAKAESDLVKQRNTALETQTKAIAQAREDEHRTSQTQLEASHAANQQTRSVDADVAAVQRALARLHQQPASACPVASASAPGASAPAATASPATAPPSELPTELPQGLAEFAATAAEFAERAAIAGHACELSYGALREQYLRRAGAEAEQEQ